MGVFNADRALESRTANPRLSIFDTGEMLEPMLERERPKGVPVLKKTGVVSFTNDESSPVLQIFAHPSAIEADTTLVQIDTLLGDRFTIMLNEAAIYSGNPETDRADSALAEATETTRAMVVAARLASGGSSNDDEIEALQDALSAAIELLEMVGIVLGDEIPDHRNDLGDWCPNSGTLAPHAFCPAGCAAAAPDWSNFTCPGGTTLARSGECPDCGYLAGFSDGEPLPLAPVS